MAAKEDDRGLIFGTCLAIGLAIIWPVWHYGVRFGLSVPNRMDMWDLAREHWAYHNNFASYLAWRWPPMIDVWYSEAFWLTVLPSVLLYGSVVAVSRRSWLSLAQAAIGWVVGGLLGYALMTWVPMPNDLIRAFAMPALALLLGGLLPLSLASPSDATPVRGTRIRRHQANSVRVMKAAVRKGRTALVGTMLPSLAEVRHLAAIGTTGSGKSVALLALMHTALRRGDRHVVTDPDGGAMRLFFQDGDVILNPADARSARWDMLGEIAEDTDYRLLTEALVPSPREDQGSEWLMYAREVFATCLETWHQCELGDSDAFFHVMATGDREKLAQLCEGRAAHRYFETGNEKMLGSIMGTLAPALGAMRQLARLQGAPFSVRRWVREGTGSLWMPYRASQIPALRGLISCWMGLAISATLSLSESKTRRTWFHIDELDALGRIQGLKDALARLRKVGGCVVLGLQSISQVRAVYGEAEANTIVENCHNKLILNCGASEGGGTARFASQVIGDREVEREEITTSRSQGRQASSSSSRATRRHREPAVMDSEIMQLDIRSGYFKLATQPDWLRVSYPAIDFSPKVEAYVPAEPALRDAAE